MQREGGEREQHVTRLLTSFLTSAIHSRRRRDWLTEEGKGGETLPFRCSSRGKDFHRDILRGGDVMSPFVFRGRRDGICEINDHG